MMIEWINVLDRLPEPGERVIATNGSFTGEAWIGERNKWTRPTGFTWMAILSSPVTHWQPMPVGPEQEAKL